MEYAENSPRGMPIQEDSHVRSVVDSLNEDDASGDWYPANKMAVKLWQCLEVLRDIDVALESAFAQKNSTKRKRQLKQFSVQLHSFATAVVSLCDQIVGDPDARSRLEVGTTKQISAIKSEFMELIPISHKGDLSVLRNRMAGHIDRDLAPSDAREILSRDAISSFGKWLHVCLHAMLDLLKLDIYSWSVRSDEGYLRLMNSEPFLVTFDFNGKVARIVAVHVSKRSPRYVVADVAASIVRNSQWMFKRGEVRIGALREGDEIQWNTFTGSRALWNSQNSSSDL